MPTQTQSRTSTPSAPAPARPDGLVGVFATLADQHAQAAAMFDQIKAEPQRRGELWAVLRSTLVSHEHGEVRELYPRLRQFEQTAALADEHDAQAAELDALIHRLDLLPVELDAWTAVFDQLVATVLQHAKVEEEQRIFPAAQQAIGEAMALELDVKLRDAQAKLAPANLMAH